MLATEQIQSMQEVRPATTPEKKLKYVKPELVSLGVDGGYMLLHTCTMGMNDQ